LRRFLERAEERGHNAELVLLREKSIRRCGGCMLCDETGACRVNDDMQIIFEKMKGSDLIVFGSPNYQNNVPGMMKDFFDRINPFYKSRLLADKKMVSICTGASANPDNPGKMKMVIGSVADLFGLEYVSQLYLLARNPQDVAADAGSLQKIDDFAKNILS
jgi:multimeric flavodoxin WrbA